MSPLPVVVLDHGDLRVHGLGGFLLLDLDGTHLDLLATFGLVDEAEGLIDIRLDVREEARGLLNGLFPALHEREALRGEPGGQSELVHFHGRGQFYDEALAASKSLGRFPHPLDSRSRTVHATRMASGRHDLT